MNNNIILLTDSYKATHYGMYMPDTEKVYTYLEARTGAKFNKTVFFGLQYILKKYFSKPITQADIDEAEKYLTPHLKFTGKGFNKEGWEYILKEHGGYLPVKIQAVPEGRAVDVSNVMLTIENTDPKCAWLTNYLETVLMQLWYPCTVATLSREVKILINSYMKDTCDSTVGLDYMLWDFGVRGTSSMESACIGGAANLIFFQGTDNIPALQLLNDYYYADTSNITSVAASEHSIMTSRGEAGEWDVVENILKEYPEGILSLVIDSYDYSRFIDTVSEKFKQQILNRKGTLVFRPDSGDPVNVTIDCLQHLEKHFGTKLNSKGFKELPSTVRVLWGDGIDYQGVRNILFAMKNHGWAANNMACFGMGGGLLQKVNRDTQRFAAKCSAQYYKGAWHDVYKKPKDISKVSKAGRLALLNEGGKFTTAREEAATYNLLETVYENGKILKQINWGAVKMNSLLDA